MTKHYLDDLEPRWNQFAAFIGESATVSEITAGQVNDFLFSLIAKRSGGPMTGAARNNVRRQLCTLFAFAIKPFKACVENPAEAATLAKVTESPVGIFTPEQLATLLAHAPAEWVPCLAIGAFAGLRTAELLRLDWGEVDIVDGCIEVTALNAKSARRRICKILPALDAWIRERAKPSGPVAPCRHFTPHKMLAEASRAAGIGHWPKNALRHSFASYHIAHFKDAAALALEMGHTKTDLIFRHYRQVVRAAEGARYWEIMPAGSEESRDVVPFTPTAALQ